MSNYSNTSNYSSGAPGDIPPPSNNVLTQQQFLDRVDYAKSEIRSLSSNISQIATLHQRALSSPDSSSTASLEALVTETQLKNTKIRDQIKYLEADAIKTHDGTKNVKSTQAKRLKTEFENQLQQYREEELNYRNEYRRQIGRQYRIVNPEATEAEVEEASQMDWGSEGVFQTAVCFIWLLPVFALSDPPNVTQPPEDLLTDFPAQIKPIWSSLVSPRSRACPSQRTPTYRSYPHRSRLHVRRYGTNS